jgi:ribosome-associated protein
MEFIIKGPYIELMALLKLTGIAASGGEAGTMIVSGNVKRNGETELRKRAKLVPGDIIEAAGQKIEIK